MSIFEYDKDEEEKKLRKAEYEAGVQAGIEVGMDTGIKVGTERKLIELVCKKLLKKIPVSEIADMLEEEVDTIQQINDVAAKYAPEYDIEKIEKECRALFK